MVTVADIQRVLKKWKMRNLTLERKIIYFKTTAISKIAFPSFMTIVPKYIVNENEKNTKELLWKNSIPKIKHETLCDDYEAGELKIVNIPKKNYSSSMVLDKKAL